MIQLEKLAEVGSTSKGLNSLYEAKRRLQKKIAVAKASGNRKTLTRNQKQFFYSPAVRYAAFVLAVRSHWNVKQDDVLLEMSESLEEEVTTMDWHAKPSPRPIHPIFKPDGSQRQVSASANHEDSAREILLKWMLEAEWQTGLDTYSYSVKDAGVPKALAAVSDYLFCCPKLFLKLDIKDCYKNLDSSFLEEQLRAVLTEFAFNKVQPFLQVAYRHDAYTWREANGIPQGGRVSALVLEILLKDLSAFVTDGLDSKQLFFARYVDDLLLLSSDTEILAVAEKRLSEWLTIAGLRFNDAKRLAGSTGVEAKPSSDCLEPAFKFLGWQVAQYARHAAGAYQTVFRFIADKEVIAVRIREGKLEGYKNAIEAQGITLQEQVGHKAEVIVELNENQYQAGFSYSFEAARESSRFQYSYVS